MLNSSGESGPGQFLNQSVNSQVSNKISVNTSSSLDQSVHSDNAPAGNISINESGKMPEYRPMKNFTDSMIKDAGFATDGGEKQAAASVSIDAATASKQQKVITFKNRDYLLYEGRIIDEREADRIYTQYHELLSQKAQSQATAQAAAAVSKDNSLSDNDPSCGNESSHNAVSSGGDIAQSNAQWKKDETMLLQYIILNVADQRNTLVENFSDTDWQTVANLVPGRTSLQCQKRWLFIQNIEGKKSAWTARETEILKRIAEEITAQSVAGNLAQPKEWTRIAEEFNKAVGPGS